MNGLGARDGLDASRPETGNLAQEKRQQVLALGRLGWSLRRIEAATGVRRKTASTYLKAAGHGGGAAAGPGRAELQGHPAESAMGG